jgi:hypothetical protein
LFQRKAIEESHHSANQRNKFTKTAYSWFVTAGVGAFVPVASLIEIKDAVATLPALGVTMTTEPFFRSEKSFASLFKVIFVSESIRKVVEASAPLALTVIFLSEM